MNYFKDKNECMKKAEAHTAEMENYFKEEIEQCVRSSEIIELAKNNENGSASIPVFPVTDLKNVTILNMSTTSAIEYEAGDRLMPFNVPDAPIRAIHHEYGNRIAVLNFASFKHPGGMFIEGSMAQEESLCHVSYLYNVLSRFQNSFYKENQKLLNRSLYANRGIYSPGVRFMFRDTSPLYTYDIPVDVFTIAAPNAGAARRIGVPEQDIRRELTQRIHFVIRSILDHGPYLSVILGAFGCGVFKNSPEMVAEMFYRELDNMECRDKFHRVVFAIIGDNNIEPFQKLLKDRRDSFGKSSEEPSPMHNSLIPNMNMNF